MATVSHPLAQRPGDHARADAFLDIQAQRSGKIKGEAISPGQVDNIVVNAWHWGLKASFALGTTEATGRRSYTALTIHKNVDRATTGLMAALARNDAIKSASLILRRAGGIQEPFLIISVKEARVVAVEHAAGDDGVIDETLSLVFTKVAVEYWQQLSSGLGSGAIVFEDEMPIAD